MRYLIIVLFVLSACSDGIKTLPSSTGILSEVIFVVEDALWENQVKDVVFRTFGSLIQGLPQDESSFSVVQINPSQFKSIYKIHKNIVIIAKNIPTSNQEDKWAYGQFVAHLGWDNNASNLAQSLKKLREIFVLKEINSIRISLAKISQKKIEETLKLNFKIDCIVPKEYVIHENSESFFSARSTSSSVKSDEFKHIFTFSFVPKLVTFREELLQKTDSIFEKYLIGTNKGSYGRIEQEYHRPVEVENTYRGLWKLENEFMGGPFLIKTYFVEDKIVVNVGLVYAPHTTKRKYIKELEAIL